MITVITLFVFTFDHDQLYVPNG